MKDTSPIEPGSLSIVVPFYNEEENVAFVLAELHGVLPAAELVAVDDGSSDGTWREMRRLPYVRALRLARNSGQSAAIYHGLHECTRPWCGLMDGDGQNDPANFPLLLQALNRSTADVACGCRTRRNDVWSRRAASRVANGIRRLWLRDGVSDTGCSQKLFPRTAVAHLVPFRGMHRYLPALFRRAGLTLIEVPVAHRERRAGTSKYTNWRRGVAGVYDLVGVRWLLSRKIPPPTIERAYE